MLTRAAKPDPDWLPWSLRSVYRADVVSASADPLIEIRAVLLDEQRVVSPALVARLDLMLCDGFASPLLHADPNGARRACGELAAAFRFAPPTDPLPTGPSAEAPAAMPHER